MTGQNKTYCRFVSIIIPALNEEKNIGRCLDSIAEMDCAKSNYEVMVIDNGSRDTTLEIAESYKSKLSITTISAPGVNIAALRNIGAAKSRGDILAFVDADCTVSINWIRNALPYFEDHATGAVGSNVGIPENSTWVAKTWDINLSQNRKLGEIDCLPTGNLFVSKVAYSKIQGFNEDLVTNEDYDLCYRLRQQGLKIYSDPEIRVIHWGVPANLVEFYKREVWHGTHVFKVFLNNIIELKNLKAVVYALYFTFCLMFCFASFLYFVIYRSYLCLSIPIVALLAPPVLLSLRVMIRQRLSGKNFMQLGIIYFVYGIARAVSIMKIRNWIFPKNK